MPRSAACCAAPPRYAARPRASSASQAGCSASRPAPGRGDIGIQPPPCLRSLEWSLLPKTITCLSLSVLSPLPGHPARRWCHLRLGLGGRRDGDMEQNAPPAVAKHHPGPIPGLGAAAGPSCKRGSPLARCPGHQPGRKRPPAPPGQAGLDRTTDALHLPLLFGPVEAVFEGQRGRSAAESRGSRHPQEPLGFPEAARQLAGAAETRGLGVEYICFIFLIKTKASKVAQRGPAVGSRHPPAK